MATCPSYILILRVVESALKILTENQRETHLSASQLPITLFMYGFSLFSNPSVKYNQSAYAVYKNVLISFTKYIVKSLRSVYIG